MTTLTDRFNAATDEVQDLRQAITRVIDPAIRGPLFDAWDVVDGLDTTAGSTFDIAETEQDTPAQAIAVATLEAGIAALKAMIP